MPFVRCCILRYTDPPFDATIGVIRGGEMGSYMLGFKLRSWESDEMGWQNYVHIEDSWIG